MSKVIQVPIDDELLSALDWLSRERRQSRAALIREACRRYLEDEQRRELDELYEDGYRRLPEDEAVGAAQVAVAGEVLPKEPW